MDSSAVIGAGNQGGEKSWQYHRDIDAHEIRELEAKATAPHWRRFFFLGFVVYEDIFGARHTQRFCVKVRRSGWQAIKGGESLNQISHSETPAEPETPAEDELDP